MKEEDLKKNLDRIIIEGLIKEAEQENADFEAAMKKMSHEDFLELIMNHEHVKEDQYAETGVIAEEVDYDMDESPKEFLEPVLEASSYKSVQTPADSAHKGIYYRKAEIVSDSESKEFLPKEVKRKPFKKFVPWITSALAAAACILAIVLPTVHHANGKLCDGALMMSQQYMTSSKGSLDIASVSEEEVKNMLPMLEKNYNDCIKVDGKSVTYTPGLQECGWDLTLAYLKLHKKGKAIDVLKVLVQQYQGTAFGDHCENLLKQLD